MYLSALAIYGSASTNAGRGKDIRQGVSDIDALSDAQGIFEFNAKVAHYAIDLRVT
jgi:hypothetical protein